MIAFWRMDPSLSAGGKRRGITNFLGPVTGLVIETSSFWRAHKSRFSLFLSHLKIVTGSFCETLWVLSLKQWTVFKILVASSINVHLYCPLKWHVAQDVSLEFPHLWFLFTYCYMYSSLSFLTYQLLEPIT